ncbi:MAG: zinc ribbon domain-containing protein [Bacilli bacterium]|nr:zinc ribbon domain-containing protein [Bacilli bacterium]
MPHSSGGGSSGGGFHSGSGGRSSGPSYRTSSRYFPGSTCYVYYGRGGLMRTVYLSGDAKAATKSKITSIIAVVVFMLIGIGIGVFTGFHNPHKISSDYSTTITIEDNTDILSEDEETTLKQTFNEFYTLSGICPSVVAIPNSTWNTHYASLQGYAYDKYLSMFKDESHWLIVYSDDGNKANWHFEGMQGNDTDPVLSVRVTDSFNSFLYDKLSNSSQSVGVSINEAFRHIMPTMMNSYFGIDTPVLIFLIIWEGVLAFALVSTIINAIRTQGLKNGFKISGDLVKKNCPSCGCEYAEGTVRRCPKCGHQLADEKYASFHSNDLP